MKSICFKISLFIIGGASRHGLVQMGKDMTPLYKAEASVMFASGFGASNSG